ncbi:MAG TPA: 1-acyl-sn-glycerol-3-phosphate acyltransferase [Longimicrobiaceae bacterium]|nr:1-acyl-sn-glycerol-3-phosphate acyltransferase [Longimicrobiaceae bacterium]
MTQAVSLPLWLALLLAALAAAWTLERLLVPGARWIVRQRTNRVIEEINTRLRIELPPFKLTKRKVLIDRLTYDPRVMEAVDAHAREHGMPREVVMARVERYAREIVPAFNAYLYFRVGYWLGRRVARLLYRVRLGYSDEDGLAAVERGSTVVFVMNHRSNMDYVLVGYLAARRAALSYAVGEWARVWPLHMLIRSMGAYFVRRNSGDELYRRVLERYVAMATAAGVTQAVYPEGGLSRDGRLRQPKLGLLDYLVRSWDPGGGRDLVFIPVGINYDRVLEDRTLLLELEPAAPRPGRARALANAFRFVGRNLLLAARNRWYRFGYACVNFGSPVSMRAYCAGRGVDFAALPREERFAEVEALGRTLMDEVGRTVPVVPVPLVAAVFARDPRRAWSELELKAELHRTIGALEAAGGRIYVPRRDLDYALTVGLRMLVLRHVVEEDADGLLRAREAELPLLRYYANSIAHLLPRAVAVPAVVGDAVAATAPT